MQKNVFNRTLRITLFDVESGPEGDVVMANPIVPRDYIISPLNLADIDFIETWIKQKTLDLFVESAKLMRDISRDEFLDLVARETRRVSELSWTADESMKLLSTVDGLACIIHRALTCESGKVELTAEKLKLMLQCPENQMEALKAVKRLDTLDAWGVSHPTAAQSPGQQIAETNQALTDVLLKTLSAIS